MGMEYPERLDFFDVSVIVPFLKEGHQIKMFLQEHYIFFERNGIEIVFCSESSQEDEQLNGIYRLFPYLNIKIVRASSTNSYEINAFLTCIEASSFRYILFLGHISMKLESDIVFLCRHRALFDKNFIYIPYCEACSLIDLSGLFFITKVNLVNAISVRSDMAGHWYFEWLKSVLSEQAVNFYRFNDIKVSIQKPNEYLVNAISELPCEILEKVYLPEMLVSREKLPLPETIVSYQRDIKIEGLELLLSECTGVQFSKGLIGQKFKVVALVNFQKGKKTIAEYWDHIQQFCDAFILMTSPGNGLVYSTDPIHEKLILKFETNQNDLTNQWNYLYKVANFIQADWFLCLWGDEKLICTNSLYEFLEQDVAPTIGFYKSEGNLKRTKTHSVRVFKNKGFLQRRVPIGYDSIIPYTASKMIIPVLIESEFDQNVRKEYDFDHSDYPFYLIRYHTNEAIDI